MGQWIKGMHNDHLPKRNQKETKWQWRRGVTLGPREKTHNHLCIVNTIIWDFNREISSTLWPPKQTEKASSLLANDVKESKISPSMAVVSEWFPILE
jgi:hypothetical protein